MNSAKMERVKKELAPHMVKIDDQMVKKLIKFLITGVLDFSLDDYTKAFQ